MKPPEWQQYALCFFIAAVSIASVGYGLYLVIFVLSSLAKLLGGFFLGLLLVNAAFNMAGCYYYLRSFSCSHIQIPKLRKFPRVAVLVPARNEKFETVRKTLLTLLQVDYPKEKLAYYLLDNSTRPDRKLAAFCKSNGISYRYLENPVRLKSYALNKILPDIKEEYIALFDADDALVNDQFLKENLGFLLEDETLASVQTKKEYAPGSAFANAVNAYYAFFYNFIQPVRHFDKSGMFCGSVGIIRKSAVEKIGGFPASPTEDTAFSFRADLYQGMGGAFNPRVYALGEPIETFSTLLAQQWRYTIGNTWLAGEYVKKIFSIPVNKQLHYASQVFSFMYLSYLFIFYALLTLAFVLLNIGTSLFASLAFIPKFTEFVAFSYMIAIIIMVVAGAKLYYGSYRIGLTVLFMNFALALTRARAVVVAFLGLPTRFVMTRQSRGSKSILEAAKLAKAETAFAAVLLVFAVVSFARLDFVSGIWLFWYAWMFSSALVFAWSTDLEAKAKPALQSSKS